MVTHVFLTGEQLGFFIKNFINIFNFYLVFEKYIVQTTLKFMLKIIFLIILNIIELLLIEIKLNYQIYSLLYSFILKPIITLKFLIFE